MGLKKKVYEMEKRKCINCGKEFLPNTKMQKYCSRSCGSEFRKKNDINSNWPKKTFVCAYCGKKVTTKGNSSDKRTRFCSNECQEKFWKHGKSKKR